jgi:hypothetical protein
MVNKSYFKTNSELPKSEEKAQNSNWANTFGFEKALELLKEGSKVTRLGWENISHIQLMQMITDDEFKTTKLEIVSRNLNSSMFHTYFVSNVDILATDWIEGTRTKYEQYVS